MALERYARAAWVDSQTGIELHPGVEYRAGDDVEQMTVDLQFMAQRAFWATGANHVALADRVCQAIKYKWPDRAFFIETEENGRGVQVYDPKDFVKERCNCPCTRRKSYCTHNQTDIPAFMCAGCTGDDTPGRG